MRKWALFLVLFSGVLASTVQAQVGGGTVIASNSFEGVETWAFTNSGSAGSGATNVIGLPTDVPTNARIRTGSFSWQNRGLGSPATASNILTFSSIDISTFTNRQVVLRVASISTNSVNGAEQSDHVFVYVALDGAAFSAVPDIRLHGAGGNNARWGFDATNYIKVAVGGTASNNAPQTGTSSNNYASLGIDLPNTATSVAVRVITRNNDQAEVWAIDDVEIHANAPGWVGPVASSPEVIITTANTAVPFSTNSYDIAGTANANTVGELAWTNSLTGASGTIPVAANWTIPNIALGQGVNNITVSGTNSTGSSAQDTVAITRQTLNVSFTSSGSDVSETSGSYTVTVFKSLSEGDVTGTISVGGSALQGTDFTIDTTNFVMNGATTSATFVITIIDNLDFGPGYTVLLAIDSAIGGTIISPSSFTLTIGDNDQPAEGIAAFRFNVTPYLEVSTRDANITVSNMSLSSGGTIEVNQQTGTDFPFEPFIQETGGWTANNQAAAKAFQFNIAPNSGYKVSVTGFSFRAYSTGAGPSALGFDISGGAATFSMNITNDVLQEVSAGISGVVDMTNSFNILIQGWTNGTRSTSGGGVLRLDDVVVFGTVTTTGGGGGETFLDEYDADNISITAGTVSVTVNITSNGVPYSLLFTTNLLAAPTPTGTADTEVATGGPVTLQDSSTAEPYKFYWIRTND
jgi:hypothetical protein